MPCAAAYLRRIGLLGPEEPFSPDAFPPTLATLRTLQFAHLTHVPYETFDIVQGRPFGLRVEELFDKIVTRRRGGYCFELNGLFAWLLRELGFPVTEFFARFLRDADPGIPQRRHRVLLVTVPEGDYIADVGVGGVCPLYPLKLEVGLEQDDPSGRYRFATDPFYGWVIEERKREGWEGYYAFTEEVQTEHDYDYANFYCQHAPDSFFRGEVMCCVQTPDGGRRTIKDGEFRIFTPTCVEIRTARDDAEYARFLQAYFGICLN